MPRELGEDRAQRVDRPARTIVGEACEERVEPFRCVESCRRVDRDLADGLARVRREPKQWFRVGEREGRETIDREAQRRHVLIRVGREPYQLRRPALLAGRRPRGRSRGEVEDPSRASRREPALHRRCCSEHAAQQILTHARHVRCDAR